MADHERTLERIEELMVALEVLLLDPRFCVCDDMADDGEHRCLRTYNKAVEIWSELLVRERDRADEVMSSLFDELFTCSGYGLGRKPEKCCRLESLGL